MTDEYDVPQVVVPKKERLNLKNTISGITHLSNKVKLVLVAGIVLLLGLLFFALDGMDNKSGVEAAKKAKEEVGQQSGGTTAAIMPKSVSERPDVVPVIAAKGLDRSGPAPILDANGKVVIGKSDAVVLQPGGGVVAKKDGVTVIVPKLDADYSSPPLKSSTPEDLLRETRVAKMSGLREQAIDGAATVKGFADTGADVGLGGNGRSIVPPSSPSPMTPGQMLAAANGQDDPNKQGRKEKFVEAAAMAVDNGYLASVQIEQISKYELKAGAIIPCLLQAAINSDLPGMIRGIVLEDVHDSRSVRHLLVPRGTQVVGTYDSQIAFGQSRLLVVWNKLVFPNGSTMALKGMPGADEAGAAGLTGDVDNHWTRIFGAAAATSVISALLQASQGPVSNGANAQPSMSQTMAASLGQQLGQVGAAISQKNMAVQPTITVPLAARFYINVTKDMVFVRPYKAS